RPEPTCFVRLAASAARSSSPPSPLLLRAPRLFIAVAIVRCASGDSAPTDIADAKNRRTIAAGASTLLTPGTPAPRSAGSQASLAHLKSRKSRTADGGRPYT